MQCYKDMAFCTFYESCDRARECHRPATEAVRNEAKQAKDPMVVFAERPQCWMPESD